MIFNVLAMVAITAAFFGRVSSKKVIDELRRRTGREIDYPDKISRANQYARIWFAAIMLLTLVVMAILMKSKI